MFTGESLQTAYQQFPALPTKGYQLNNQHNNVPPKMNDGRTILASWQPNAVVNEKLLQDNGIKSNWQYRRYLMNNSKTICENLLQDSLNDVGYSVRHEKPDLNRVFETPKVYESIQEPLSHRQAQPSDLQSIYLSREQLQARMEVPTWGISSQIPPLFNEANPYY